MGGRGSKGKSGGGGNSGNEKLKVGDEAIVKDWFTFDLPNYAKQPSKVEIIGESASGKAWKVSINTETKDGERDLYYTKFMPKSAAQSKKEYAKEKEASNKRYEKGVKEYAKMLDFAKKNGVKGVRKGLKKEKILQKIKDAGLNYS